MKKHYRWIVVVGAVACQPPMQRSTTQQVVTQQVAVVKPTEFIKRENDVRTQVPQDRSLPLTSPTIVFKSKTFHDLSEGTLLFSARLPQRGWWSFCVAGVKDRGVRLSYLAVLPLGGDAFQQVDHFVMVYENETKFNYCLNMSANEKELPAGQEIQIRSRFAMPGSLTASATYRILKPSEIKTEVEIKW